MSIPPGDGDSEMFDENAEERSNDTARGGGGGAAVKASDDPKSIEKDILRYYYYIHNGIDTEHVAPLENVRIQNTLSKTN